MEILDFLNIPRVVATVHQPADLDFLGESDLSKVCDLLEFRLDSLRDHLDRTETTIAATKLPCIVTARHPDEGGDGDLDAASRAAMLERFLPHSSLVDLEVRSLRELNTTVELARESTVGVIASFHDFEKTPPLDDLHDVLQAALAAGADVTKIAIRLNSMTSMLEVVQFVEVLQGLDGATPWQNLSLMGMGPLGKLSRLVFSSTGSCLNYGYLREPNAPGQWPAEELKRLIGELGSEERKATGS